MGVPVVARNCTVWLSSFGFFFGFLSSFSGASVALRFAFFDSRGGGNSNTYPSGGGSPPNRRNSMTPCSNASCTTATFASFLLRYSAGTVQERFSCSWGFPVNLTLKMHPHAGRHEAFSRECVRKGGHTHRRDLSCTQTFRVACSARTCRTP